MEEIAGWYEGECPLTDVRAQQAFVEQYVDVRADQYRHEQHAEPGRRQIEEWKRQARERWMKRQREGASLGMAAD